MLPEVKTKVKKLKDYKGIIKDSLFSEIKELTKDLNGLKVVMINATPKGGGVAEILNSLIPLMRGLNIDARWHVIPAGQIFSGLLTKKIHNALQGQEYTLPQSSRKLYLQHTEKLAKLLKDMKADVWILHDPQPAGLISCLPNLHPSISHIHIDTSCPNESAWNFIEPFLLQYDKIVFSLKDFVARSLPSRKVVVFPPAIDPLTKKNKALVLSEAKRILAKLGIDTKKPLISQISRFDPWKDPLGVIKAWRLAKKKIPDLQLAYAGIFLALDDPDAIRIFRKVEKVVKNEKDIFLFADPKYLGNLEIDTFVNALQVGSDIILQKSIREGFGLTVTEAMWKEKPVIGGKVGGIKLQIENGKSGFLVLSPEEASKKIVQLIENPTLANKLGKAAKERVREKFLIPRLLRNYLKLFQQLT
jgi:trehalose synthase